MKYVVCSIEWHAGWFSRHVWYGRLFGDWCLCSQALFALVSSTFGGEGLWWCLVLRLGGCFWCDGFLWCGVWYVKVVCYLVQCDVRLPR